MRKGCKWAGPPGGVRADWTRGGTTWTGAEGPRAVRAAGPAPARLPKGESSCPHPQAGVLTTPPPSRHRRSMPRRGPAAQGTGAAATRRRELCPGPRPCDRRCPPAHSAGRASLCQGTDEPRAVWTSRLLLREDNVGDDGESQKTPLVGSVLLPQIRTLAS